MQPTCNQTGAQDCTGLLYSNTVQYSTVQYTALVQ